MITAYSVRSGIHKHSTGRLVLEWVTIWESRLLYVPDSIFFAHVSYVIIDQEYPRLLGILATFAMQWEKRRSLVVAYYLAAVPDA
jgi:hypothetical protein